MVLFRSGVVLLCHWECKIQNYSMAILLKPIKSMHAIGMSCPLLSGRGSSRLRSEVLPWQNLNFFTLIWLAKSFSSTLYFPSMWDQWNNSCCHIHSIELESSYVHYKGTVHSQTSLKDLPKKGEYISIQTTF